MKSNFKWLLFIVSMLLSLSLHAQITGYAKSGEVNIHYRIYGKGDPLLLLSGGPGFSSDGLLFLIDSLKDKYKLILVDQRGTGMSVLEKIDSTTITMDKYVEDINNVRKALGINKWIVLGHSWGGALAMAVTAKYPENTSKMILICSMGIDLQFLEYSWDNLKYSKQDLDNLDFWSDSTVISKNPERAAYERYRSILPARVYDYSSVSKIMVKYKPEYNSSTIASLMIQNLYSIQYNLKPQLKKFQQPTLIIEGRQDFLGGWNAFTTYTTIPNCRIEFIEKCGHFPFVERPDIFFKILKNFLSQ